MSDDPKDVDLLDIARQIIAKFTPEERAEVVREAERFGVTEEYVVLEAILQLDFGEDGQAVLENGESGKGEPGSQG